MENEEEKIITGEQGEIKDKRILNLLPYQFKKGQSGNPSGRPKGRSLKEYAKDMLCSMTDEERQEFLHGLPKETIWKLAEGNPESKTDVVSDGKPLQINLIRFNEDDNASS